MAINMGLRKKVRIGKNVDMNEAWCNLNNIENSHFD